jgi:dCTP deaminase
MLLSYNQLIALVEDGVIQGSNPESVNSASIDIHLGKTILVERAPRRGTVLQLIGTDEPTLHSDEVIDYAQRQPLNMEEVDITNGYVLRPGEFILAHSLEVFNLPEFISAEYKLKSSMARIGLEHLTAGWCDAGWQGSVLTLEFKNMTQWHSIRLEPGLAIGQMVFFAHEPVPDDRSYAARGRYNGDCSVSGIKE